MDIWEKFDKEIDVEGLKHDAEEAAKNGGNFKEVPYGTYEVKVNKMELKESKTNKPMLSIWFKILDGEYKDSIIFYNQVLSTGFGLHSADNFLRSLDSGVTVEFKNFRQYNNLILDIAEAIDGVLEYGLEYSEGKNGFNNYKITDVFDV
ncbi:DUF669 domain-containing protein [Clostridium tyrobutyricum]|jgi:hypothetical protein|uniref:DUF669 domain-containing protein n=1 Tax=Clostridium tyrobutyricum TaxID=1519 RepID=UPI00242EAFAA|nr:DUF669 domain-containing protein [Clostridium tyrobutyricum]